MLVLTTFLEDLKEKNKHQDDMIHFFDKVGDKTVYIGHTKYFMLEDDSTPQFFFNSVNTEYFKEDSDKEVLCKDITINLYLQIRKNSEVLRVGIECDKAITVIRNKVLHTKNIDNKDMYLSLVNEVNSDTTTNVVGVPVFTKLDTTTRTYNLKNIKDNLKLYNTKVNRGYHITLSTY